MKKWLRRALIAVLVLGLTLGVIYESATHVGRGWLGGEAFFQDRPTSWWRGRIDAWAGHFLTQDDALLEIGPADFMNTDMKAVAIRPPTYWDRVRDWFRSQPERFRELEPPEVLQGAAEADMVLDELAQDARYRPFVERARKSVMRR